MKNVMDQADELSVVLGDQSVHRLVSIEEAGPGHAGDFIGQGGRAETSVELVVALPQREPLGEIRANYWTDNHGHGQYLQRCSLSTAAETGQAPSLQKE